MPGGHSGSDELAAIVGICPPVAAKATSANQAGKARKMSGGTAELDLCLAAKRQWPER